MENSKAENSRTYDLEERTFEFAKNVRSYLRTLPRTMANIEDGKQLLRCSGSVGANDIEANESLGRKDFLMRVKICRKEAKESRFFLRLLRVGDDPRCKARRDALQEATELTSIFDSIVRKTDSRSS
jgi:four helix bundle protein